MENVIDVIGVNPMTGAVELAVADDLPWDEYDKHMEWLIAKLNLYLRYVLTGEIVRQPAYANRPVRFVVHFNGRPPLEARLTMCNVRDHLAKHNVVLAVTDTGNIAKEVDIDNWARDSI